MTAPASRPGPAPQPRAAVLARLVSVVLHPFAVFMALALLAAWRLDRASFGRTVLGMTVVIAVVAAFIVQRRRGGHWQTVDASEKRDRPLLYALVLAVLLGYAAWMGPSSPTVAGVLAVLAMVCVAALLNGWIKLSLHLASLAFAGVAMLSLSPSLAATALVLLPVLAWSRLALGRHTPAEVAGGAVLGLLTGWTLRQLG